MVSFSDCNSLCQYCIADDALVHVYTYESVYVTGVKHIKVGIRSTELISSSTLKQAEIDYIYEESKIYPFGMCC